MSNNTKPVFMLSTTDNPYDPFTQWDQWEAFDRLKGYNTPQRLALLVPFSEETLSIEEINFFIDDAIETFLLNDLTANYIKVEEGKFINRKIT